jgi:hypothetical protein
MSGGYESTGVFCVSSGASECCSSLSMGSCTAIPSNSWLLVSPVLDSLVWEFNLLELCPLFGSASPLIFPSCIMALMPSKAPSSFCMLTFFAIDKCLKTELSTLLKHSVTVV